MTPTRRRSTGALVVIALGAAIGWATTIGWAATPTPAAKTRTQPAAKRPVAAHADTAARALPDTTPPVFTGTWELDTAKSVFGNIPGGRPTTRTDVIEHEGSRIRQVLYLLRGSQRDTTTYLYSTDGTPTVNVVDKRDIKTVVTWEGRMLHLVSTAHLLMFEMTMDERWQLAADGRTLAMIRYIRYPLGEGGQRLVFSRR